MWKWPHLKSWSPIWTKLCVLIKYVTFICLCSQRSCTKVRGHLRSSCKIGWKCENGLIWKVEVLFEPNLVYWYNMETFICSCSQRSQIKIKGHLRSTCKITWKCKFGLICILEHQLELLRCGDLDQMLTHIIHKPRWHTGGLVTAKRFFSFFFFVGVSIIGEICSMKICSGFLCKIKTYE